MGKNRKKEKKLKQKKPIGRPTNYRPEYCQMLIRHMSEGLSFESFAAITDQCRETLYDWIQKYPDFLHAKKKGVERCQLFWEKLGRAGAAGKVPYFNNATWIFNMKNRFGWRDVQDITHNFDERIGKIKIEIVNPKK